MPPLHESWVEKIFEKLTLTYGRAFLGRWEGLDIGAVKADWGRELAGYARNPQALRHALEHLPPSEPPTAGQFRALCIGCPVALPALPAPQADAERVRRLMQRARADASPKQRSPLAWAHTLLARAEAGEMKLTPTQREMMHSALQLDLRGAPA